MNDSMISGMFPPLPESHPASRDDGDDVREHFVCRGGTS